MPSKFSVGLASALAILLAVSACAESSSQYPTRRPGENKPSTSGQSESLFGEGGISLFGGPDKAKPGENTGIGVNSFLWRATLDTLSFMPLASADPFGGVIITDWYAPPEAQDERFKVNVYILGSDLRADGIRAAVFRQNRTASGGWVDAQVDQQTGTDLENAILTRARQLRIAGLQ